MIPLPFPLPPLRTIAAVALFALGLAAGWTANDWRMGRKLAAEQRDRAEAKAEVSRRVAVAEHNERAEEARRQASIQEVIHVANLANDRNVRDRIAAAAEHQRLLDDARARADAARQASSDSTAASGGSAAADAIDVLQIVLERADDTAGELAAALDASHTAGLACQRAYDALTGAGVETGQVIH